MKHKVQPVDAGHLVSDKRGKQMLRYLKFLALLTGIYSHLKQDEQRKDKLEKRRKASTVDGGANFYLFIAM